MLSEIRSLQRSLERSLSILSADVRDLRKRTDWKTKRDGDPGIYSTLVRLAEHGQQNKWQTLQMFLIAQGVLLAGWTSLYAKPNDNLLLLLGICGIGFVFGLIWSRLGIDYAKASTLFSEIAEDYENHLPLRYRPLTRRREQITSKVGRITGRLATSGYLVSRVPIAFSMLYVLLAGLVVAKVEALDWLWELTAAVRNGKGGAMNAQLTTLSIGFLLGIIGSLAAAIFYDAATRPKLTILPDPNRAQGRASPVATPHEFYHVLIRQVRPLWPFPGRKPAWECKVSIETIDGNGSSVLGPIAARWASQPEPLMPTIQNGSIVNVLDFARLVAARKCNVHSHEDQPVSVALKYEGSPDCHLFSNESYLYDRWQNPGWKLGPGDYMLRVVVEYERGREIRRFKLRNGGLSRDDVLLEALRDG